MLYKYIHMLMKNEFLLFRQEASNLSNFCLIIHEDRNSFYVKEQKYRSNSR